jgi:hypothetical protein
LKLQKGILDRRIERFCGRRTIVHPMTFIARGARVGYGGVRKEECNYCLLNYDCCKLLKASAREQDCEMSGMGKMTVILSKCQDLAML